ncbi:MAG: hypothetical protein HC778_00055 [Chamaesiphon sp. CSU_1_12]|nr:hypothetical protein [Chamaesiphon sp. CSU_1_12]
MTGTISTLFIGDDGDNEAIAFMQRLANLGCGSSSINNLNLGHAQLARQIEVLTLPPAR